MKMYCISDHMDTAIGLKLTGIDAVVLQEKEEIESQIKQVLENETIGILIVTEKIYELAKNQLDEIKEKFKTPLLVKI